MFSFLEGGESRSFDITRLDVPRFGKRLRLGGKW